MFDFVGEQVLVMAQDAICLVPSRDVQRRHDEGEDASRFRFDVAVGDLKGRSGPN
jgi:hypothetical protein